MKFSEYFESLDEEGLERFGDYLVKAVWMNPFIPRHSVFISSGALHIEFASGWGIEISPDGCVSTGHRRVNMLRLCAVFVDHRVEWEPTLSSYRGHRGIENLIRNVGIDKRGSECG